MKRASCIYTGTVAHWRATPATEFSHRVALAYLDLDELPGLLGGRLVRRRPGLLRFRRSDYHGDPRVPLADAVRDSALAQTGRRPGGPVRVLTMPRSLGHCFNPVSFYWCFDRDARRVRALLADVTNTPWGECHAYVVPAADGCHALAGTFDKTLHVSPFLAMDLEYECEASVPGERLTVRIDARQQGVKTFCASLDLRRRELTSASAATLLGATLRTIGLIYGHAAALRLSGARVFPHPVGGVG